MGRVACLALVVVVVSGCGSGPKGHVYRVPSSSMEPTLHCARPAPGCLADDADLVFAVPYGNALPQRSDMVVFQTPDLARRECGSGGLFIKRLIGLPGDVWAERNGKVYIDGRPLAEPYVEPSRRDDRTMTLANLPPRGTLARIPKRRYLLLGDNRQSSCDSRVWGLAPRANIRGKVVEIKRGSRRIHLR